MGSEFASDMSQIYAKHPRIGEEHARAARVFVVQVLGVMGRDVSFDCMAGVLTDDMTEGTADRVSWLASGVPNARLVRALGEHFLRHEDSFAARARSGEQDV